MGDPVRVEVEGLNKLRNALRDIDPKLQKKLRGRFKVIAEKVAESARATMPHRSGRAAASVRGGASTTTAYVVTGRKSTAPYAAWLDFGGTLKATGGRHNTQVRPRIKGGRYLYPAIKRMRPQLQREAVTAIEETGHGLGLI